MNMWKKWIAKGNRMLRKGSNEYITFIAEQRSEVRTALMVSGRIPTQMPPHQAAALYELVTHYNLDGDELLDIGMGAGYSASIMALAAPNSHIVTLVPDAREAISARANLRQYSNVEVIWAAAWDHLEDYSGPILNMIFVDGDHKHTRRYVPWYNHLVAPHMYGAGMMLFRDYAPMEGYVSQAVDAIAEGLGREPTFSLVDGIGIGMVGFLRLEGDEV